MSQMGGGAALSAVAAARVGGDDRAVVPVDGAGGRARRADRDRPRLRRRPIARSALIGYVELIRGTPILLQLFVLYYGLAAAIRLPAFVAALLGLALNYAAYESEIYRSALEAVPTGQLEAARTLGLSERQVLTLVRAPQAFRLALAPMTNDFVALLKDSSLVSVLTVLELTKQTQIFATNLGSWVIPGTLCAALYLAMSLPLAAAGAAARAAMEGADRMSDRRPSRVDATLHLRRGDAADPRPACTLRRRARRAGRDDGTVGIRQDDDSARGRRARAVSRRARSRSTASRSTGGADIPAPTLRAAAPQGRHGVPVPLPVRASVGASSNVCLAPVHAHGVAPADGASDAALELLARVRRRAPRRRAAAPAVGRRGAARRDRARAGGRSAGAADGRADRVARSRAARRARRAAAGAAAPAAARSSSRRTTRSSRATSRRASCGCGTASCGRQRRVRVLRRAVQ